MNYRSIFFVVALLFGADLAGAQQLLIMKKGKVLARFNSGDDFRFQFKNDRQVNHIVIESVREFYLISIGQDSIPYAKIGRIVFRNPQRQKYGVSTFGMGAALLAIWGLNSLAFDTTSPSMRGLRTVGFIAVGVGAFIYFTANSGIKLKGYTRLKYASYDSPLYR